ncbi:MAG: TraB/GumN family protein [Chitinophagales bacterium]|jgi:uncharacterized protein YbaP (TraB family)|nr:TraB/GumN family protein [Chitinophagales bacterium]MBP6153442.1 TraB/GumN family protein [Chitinophagales bacterium]
MKIYHYTSLLLLVGLLAAKPPQKNEPKEKKIKLDQPISTNNSLLWQISGNGLNTPSYLFGTIHIIASEDYFLGKNVQKKVEQSDALVLEMDVDMNNINIAALTSVSILDSGRTIQHYLSDSDYQLIQLFMEDTIGINKFTFENFYARLKPFFVEQLIYLKQIGDEKELYEINLKKIAENKNKKTIGLETFEEQLQFLDAIPLENQFSSIVNTIKNYSTRTKEFNDLVQAYKNQDLMALNKAIEAEQDTSIKENLLVKRNKNWIPKIEQLIQQKTCFIAVGAGHLAGENGILELLRKQGFTVEPISIN